MLNMLINTSVYGTSEYINMLHAMGDEEYLKIWLLLAEQLYMHAAKYGDLECLNMFRAVSFYEINRCIHKL